MKKFLIQLILIISPLFASAQQMPDVTLVKRSIDYLNPGATGNKEALAANIMFKKQWISITGAPIFEAFTASAPLKDPKIALGVVIEHQKQGITNQTGFSISYAYRLPMATGKLSLGLRLGLNTGSKDNVDLRETDDPLFNQTNIKYAIPSAGFGVYYTSQKYWAGFSVPRLLNPKPNSSGGYKATSDMSGFEFLFAGGGIVPVNADITIEPSGLFVLNSMYMSFAVNVIATYKKDYNAGLGFRSRDKAIIIILGYRLNNSS